MGGIPIITTTGGLFNAQGQASIFIGPLSLAVPLDTFSIAEPKASGPFNRVNCGIYGSNGSGAGSNETDGLPAGLPRIREDAERELPEISGINWPKKPDVADPADIVEFVSKLSGILSKFISRSESADIVDRIDGGEKASLNMKSSRERLIAVRNIIAGNYGDVLKQALNKANREPEFAAALNSLRPHLVREIDVILRKADEEGDPVNQALYDSFMSLSTKIQQRFAAAKEYNIETGLRPGVPFPWVFENIADPRERRSEYRQMMLPFTTAYEEKRGILALRGEQNSLLRQAGIDKSAHDYLFERRMGMGTMFVRKIADGYLKQTREQNEKFVQMVAEALGVEKSQIRPWDVEYAKKVITERELATAPVINKAEAVAAIRRYCIDEFGIDINDPRLGVSIELVQTNGNAPSRGMSYSAVGGNVLVVVLRDSERLTLDDLRTILHETGHFVHYVLAKRHLDSIGAEGNVLLSTRLSAVTEGFANSMSNLVYDEGWVSSYLPAERFSSAYVKKYAEVTRLYDVFKIRRSIMLAIASEYMSGRQYRSHEELKQAIANIQTEILGIRGDEHYAYGIPPLADKDFDTHMMNYLLAEKLVQQIGEPSIEGFRRLVELGGALTLGSLYETMLGGSLNKILATDGAVDEFNIANIKVEEGIVDVSRNMLPLLRSGDVKNFAANLRRYLNHMVTILDLAYNNGIAEGGIEGAELERTFKRLEAFIKEVDANPWLKDNLSVSAGAVYDSVKAKMNGYHAFLELSRVIRKGRLKEGVTLRYDPIRRFKIQKPGAKDVVEMPAVEFVINPPNDLDMDNEEEVKNWLVRVSDVYVEFLQLGERGGLKAKGYAILVDWPESAVERFGEIFKRTFKDINRKSYDALNALDGKRVITPAEFSTHIVPVVAATRRTLDFFHSIFPMLLWGSQTGREDVGHLRGEVHDFNNVGSAIVGFGEQFWPQQVANGEAIDLSVLKAPFNLNSLVNWVRRVNDNAAKKNMVRLDIPVSPPKGLGGISFEMDDINKLQRILENLVNNAIKYHDPLVSEYKRSTSDPLDPSEEQKIVRSVTLRVSKGSKSVIFEIIDNGRGISAEGLAKWGSGWRAEEVIEADIPGSGTGSKIVCRLLAELGGKLKITSVKNGQVATRWVVGNEDEDVTDRLNDGTSVKVVIPVKGKGRALSPPKAGEAVTVSMLGLQDVFEALQRRAAFVYGKLRRGGAEPHPAVSDVSIIPPPPPLPTTTALAGREKGGEVDEPIDPNALVEELSKGLVEAADIIARKPHKEMRDDADNLTIGSLRDGLKLYLKGAKSAKDLNALGKKLAIATGLDKNTFVKVINVILDKEPAVQPARRQTMSGVIGHVSQSPSEVGGDLPPLLPGGLRRKVAATQPPEEELGFDGADDVSEAAFIAPPGATVVARLIHPATVRDLSIALADTSIFSPHGSPAGVQMNADMSVPDIVDKLLSLGSTQFRQAFLALYDENQRLYKLVLSELLKKRNLSKDIKAIISDVDIQIACRDG